MSDTPSNFPDIDCGSLGGVLDPAKHISVKYMTQGPYMGWFILFADDTALVATGDDINELYDKPMWNSKSFASTLD